VCAIVVHRDTLDVLILSETGHVNQLNLKLKSITMLETTSESKTQVIKFELYQLDKLGAETIAIPSEFEVKSEADVRSIAYWLLRPVSVLFQNKIELDAEYSKIKGNTKKAKLPFSTGKPVYFRLTYKGRAINTKTIKSAGNVDYYSNIKISGKNPISNAHVALSHALKVVFATEKLNTEAKIKTHFNATDELANGMIDAKKAANAILKSSSEKVAKVKGSGKAKGVAVIK
jgi:hypothetical protein